MEPFGARLAAVTAQRGRLCAGIDPHPNLLQQWGLTADADGLRAFSRTCIEAFGDIAALIKPQVALFEEYGSAGIAVLEQTLGDIHATGALSVADAKRGDIGSTMAAYARAWLSADSPLACDSVTVSPYLGFGSVQPAIDLAVEQGRGVFVLAATSNPEGASIQRATRDGVRVDQSVIDQAGRVNAEYAAAGECGPVGVVVGATLADPPQLDELRGAVLMPGVGAQGATAADVARIAGGVARFALPNISRGILSQGPDLVSLREAAVKARTDFSV
ncbi:orotidine-5'-phosphate decarboxylase [Corynebacterium sp. TAE3-ERU12]|nr:orotidine-5'-phosphate decarboxylase [Corynebacterium sp. TAE3-ERU12]MBV7295389.1 orotidine-5'-phosphate decarboxylase [Corynebacterium sp. TAE3-ERU12]